MKGSGSWSMESLHGRTLLGARGTGFVMFWDCEPGEFVRRIDVKVECGFSPIPLSLFSLIRPFFA